MLWTIEKSHRLIPSIDPSQKLLFRLFVFFVCGCIAYLLCDSVFGVTMTRLSGGAMMVIGLFLNYRRRDDDDNTNDD